MPDGWKKNAPKSSVSTYERCGGSRHHKKSHGNSNRRTCPLCSWNGYDKGNNKSSTKQKGCLKDQDKQSAYHNYEEFEDDEDDDCGVYPTWRTCQGQVPALLVVYDKNLSEFISDKFFTPAVAPASAVAAAAADASEGLSPIFSSKDESDKTENVNDDESVDDGWEIVSVESVISL